MAKIGTTPNDSTTKDSNLKGYRVKNQGSNTLEFYFYDFIGYDFWDGTGITAKNIAKELKDAGPSIQFINLHINSPGGQIYEGVTIGNLFQQQKAKVHVFIDGLAASTASVIAMCGDEIEMAGNSMMYIHKPWTFSAGNAVELREDADMLDKIEEAICKSYLAQCAKRGVKGMEEKIVEIMAGSGSWLSADEAYELGLCDTVTEPLAAVAQFDLSRLGFKSPQQHAASNGGSGANPFPNMGYMSEILRRCSPDDASAQVDSSAEPAHKPDGTSASTDKQEALEYGRQVARAVAAQVRQSIQDEMQPGGALDQAAPAASTPQEPEPAVEPAAVVPQAADEPTGTPTSDWRNKIASTRIQLAKDRIARNPV
jgi:ATP-dependent protease ClpP protease subunit